MISFFQGFASFFLLFSCAISLISIPPKALAEEPIKFKDLPKIQQEKILSGQLRSIAADLLDGLGPNEVESIYKIRTNHGVIRSVRTVEEDLSRAVQACVKKNNDMDALANNFKSWTRDIRPIIRQADKDLTEAIETQKIVAPQKLKAYLKTIDLLGIVREDILEKKYVDDRKSCKKIHDRLSDTKAELLKLLKASLETL